MFVIFAGFGIKNEVRKEKWFLKFNKPSTGKDWRMKQGMPISPFAHHSLVRKYISLPLRNLRILHILELEVCMKENFLQALIPDWNYAKDDSPGKLTDLQVE